jgi:hypothetical protein
MTVNQQTHSEVARELGRVAQQQEHLGDLKKQFDDKCTGAKQKLFKKIVKHQQKGCRQKPARATGSYHNQRHSSLPMDPHQRGSHGIPTAQASYLSNMSMMKKSMAAEAGNALSLDQIFAVQ